MTEVEYVIANFAERFAGFRGKRIVLHGSRNYAEAIIDNFANSYNFIGIMSLDPLEDEYFHGLRVLHEEDLSVFQIDIVILTERVKYAVEAFRSIRRVCKKNSIEIFNMYGVDEFRIHYEAESAKPLSLAEAQKLCSTYDIIAFEVMDTMICITPGLPDIWLRKYFYDLIKTLRRQGKQIKFSLRKSYQDDVQIEALKQFGVIVDEKNEIIKREGEDLSFRKLQEANQSKRILYFGIGLANEFILPRYYKIDTVRFVNGEDSAYMIPVEKKERKTVSFSYVSKEDIESKILEKELISFDIFDTLLIRKTLYPRDVFFLTEQKALSAGYDVKGFAYARTRAEEDQPLCSIDQIYDWLGEHFEWNDEMTYKMQEIELQTEKEILTSRTEVVELLRFAQAKGKRIVLTSDMYLPERILCKLLLINGISGYEKILVSCDAKKSKNEGLYNELLCLCRAPGKILHIGDNPVTDGLACEALGINYILIPSALKMAESRGWKKCIHAASDLPDRCLLGLIISIIFSNPFQNPNLAKCTTEKLTWRYGNSVVGPLSVGHLTWLIQRLQEKHFEGVLFLARDGWLCYNVYLSLWKRLKLPKPVYYYANRHAVFLTCADQIQECAKIVDAGYLWGIDAAEALKSVYMVPQEEILPREADESVLDFVKRHMKWICKNAEDSRKGYSVYSKKCGLLPNCSYAVYDFISVGHTQDYLARILPFKLQGFYFWNYTSAQPLDDKIEYYLQENNAILLQSFVERLEPFFSSLEPSQRCISGEGEPVFAEEHRSAKDLLEVKSVIESAEAFAKEFFKFFYQEGQIISPHLIEEIYAAEEFYLTQHTIYNDLLDTPIKRRAEAENKCNEVT